MKSLRELYRTATACRLVEVMKQTGHGSPPLHKETGEGGLARGFVVR